MLKVDTYMWFPGWSWGHWPPLHTWHKLLPCILCLGSVPPAPLHSQSLPLSPAETHTHTHSIKACTFGRKRWWGVIFSYHLICLWLSFCTYLCVHHLHFCLDKQSIKLSLHKLISERKLLNACSIFSRQDPSSCSSLCFQCSELHKHIWATTGRV